MKFPWRRRAEVAKVHRVRAEKRLEQVEADWEDVYEAAAAIQREHKLNNWTENIVNVFEGKARRVQRG